MSNTQTVDLQTPSVKTLAVASLLFLATLAWSCSSAFAQSSSIKSENRDWRVYGGALEGGHYSSLTQINKSNVKQLQVVWTFDTEESGGLQTSPIVVNGILYGLSPSQKIFALDATTGNLKWKYDPGIVGTQPDRGLAYWENGKGKDKDRRILVGVMNFVYALDAETGQP